MGAQDFQVTATGATAQATSDARYEYGHGGYTGTIAEKHDFKIEVPPSGVSAEAYIDQCMDWESGDNWAVNDKWGPACAVQTGPNEWTFFGSASS